MKTLVFHKLMSRFSWGITNYPPHKFDILLTFLQDNNHQLWSDESSDDNSDDNSVQITFDDGYRHLAEVLPPLIEKYPFTPLIFIPTAYIGLENSWDYSYHLQPLAHLSKNEIRGLSKIGVKFGSHGHNHSDLTNLSSENLRDDLYRSRMILQDIIGGEVDSISYPFGRCNSRVIDMATECGYKTGYTMSFPNKSDSLLSSGRIPIYGIDSLLNVKLKLSSGPLSRIEQAKAAIIHSFSAGTGLLNLLKGKKS